MNFAIKFKPEMDAIIAELERLDYLVAWRVLNAADYDVPHSRRRWFLVATLRAYTRTSGVLVDVFPPRVEPTRTLDTLIDVLPDSEFRVLLEPINSQAYRNALATYGKAVDLGVNPFTRPMIIDIGSSDQFMQYQVGMSPCLTKSRCSSYGYWCSTKGGPLTARELSRLQGFEELDWRGAGASASQYGAMVGNTINVNVLKFLLPRVLYMSSLISHAQFLQMS